MWYAHKFYIIIKACSFEIILCWFRHIDADKPATFIGNDFISVYPNPVTSNNFKVTFDNKAAGEYNVAVTDLQGRVIFSKQVFIASPNQVETIKLKVKPASGMYMIRVVDGNQKQVFTDKIIID